MDRYEFKKYLLSKLDDSRQEELIFWKKKIPMPVDMVYRMYDERAALFGQYTDHILSSYMFALYAKENFQDWQQHFELQPTKNQDSRVLQQIYKATVSDKGLHMLAEGITDLLMIPEHEFTEERFLHALTHEGRKYKRLYIHPEFRVLIKQQFPELLDHIATSNGDMYSNIVADILKVYRMGFADAFSVMFNKLIDYTVEKSMTGTKDYSRESRIRVVVSKKDEGAKVFVTGPVKDGSLWEPLYRNSETAVTISDSHPFVSLVSGLGAGAEEVLQELLYVMACLENESVRESDRRALEIFRQQVSRRLRIRIEDRIR
jgi:hypothetical protein